jgi:hypothetical protein
MYFTEVMWPTGHAIIQYRVEVLEFMTLTRNVIDVIVVQAYTQYSTVKLFIHPAQ